MASFGSICETLPGVADILSIGTANPPNCFNQCDYPDFYFLVTKSQHMIQLKEKFQRICEKSAIKKRYMRLTEDIIQDNPNLTIYKAPSLDSRQEIVIKEVPNLGMVAALKAIKRWGQPVTKITHLIFCTSSGIDMPSADYQLVKLIGLQPCVKRFMIYNQGCAAGATAIRLAKDLVENNTDARVLIVCSEIMAACFQPPSETHLDTLVMSALFGDGAAAMIVGVNPDTTMKERPLFEIVSAEQTILPDSEDMVVGKIREMGTMYYFSKELPEVIPKYLEQFLIETFSAIGVDDWNRLFYVVHPGGPAILKRIEQKLGLRDNKLKASWHVLREYGHMLGPSVLFVLDDIRKMYSKGTNTTTAEGLELGVLVGFDPGLTVETLVLRNLITI